MIIFIKKMNVINNGRLKFSIIIHITSKFISFIDFFFAHKIGHEYAFFFQKFEKAKNTL